MIVNMSEKATEQEIAHVIERIREAGYQPHVTRGVERTIVAAVGNGRRHEIEALLVAPGVEGVVAIAQPFKLVSRQVKPERGVVKVGGRGEKGGGYDAARWGLQAANFSLRFSGTGIGSAEDSAGGAGGIRAAGGD